VCRVCHAQYALRLLIADRQTLEPLAGATVSAGRSGVVSDTEGRALIGHQPAGKLHVRISCTGYKPADSVFQLPDSSLHRLLMDPDPEALQHVVVIASTRENEPIERAATKVEVLNTEDLNEESTLNPGNIASLLGDVSGVQIQQSSVSSGNVNIRMQGLEGRYTQLLRDDMPLYEGYSGGFGVLSIPPLDLKQIELIKGASSTLYGGGAIAGIINLLSRKPRYEPELTLLLNRTTLRETNLNGYYAQRWKKTGLTLFAGQTFQHQVDVNGDGFSDRPKLSATLIHPTLFFYPTDSSSISIGWSGSFEQRTGGDMLAIAGKQDPGHPYIDDHKPKRNTFILMGEHRVKRKLTLVLKGSLSLFDDRERTNTYIFRGRQDSYYAEVSLLKRLPGHSLILGMNTTGSRFSPAAATPVPVGSFSRNSTGLFLQDTWQWSDATRLEAGLRADHNLHYKNFVLPRLALFHRWDPHWGSRLGFGLGYAPPDPLSPQIRDYSIYQIRPLAPGVAPERSYGGNLDINYRKSLGDNGNLFINQSFFLTRVNDPVVGTEDIAGSLSFSNESGPVLTRGSDTYLRASLFHWEFYIGYTYTDALRKYLSGDPFMPVTPRNRGAATLLWEAEGKWRIGLEASYNGHQYLEDGSTTPAYWLTAVMIERQLGAKWDLVLNAENLLNARQSRYEALFTGSTADPVFKTLWAPVDGRAINCCLRYQPFRRSR
jgi:iron complex outermembrane receptor protein/outer membrane receptor for ferrienterochelin and colicins